jgi:hypothetical protein
MRTLRASIDAVTIILLIVLFGLAISRGGHWHEWRTPVIALAITLFVWTLDRYPEGEWIHVAFGAFRLVVVVIACWAEFHLSR